MLSFGMKGDNSTINNAALRSVRYTTREREGEHEKERR